MMRATGIQKKIAMTKITARMLCAGPMIVRAHACVLGQLAHEDQRRPGTGSRGTGR